MARIIDYPQVQDQMARQGLVSLYFNSGAFGFPAAPPTRSIGWIGVDDTTIRPEARALTRKVSPPVEPTLADLATRLWLDHLPGTIWLTPRSHWAYELDFGSHLWLPGALLQAGVSIQQIDLLSSRHDGSSLEFTPDESASFQALLQSLLTHLLGSDFQLSFPNRPVVCTVHHHKQLWWTSSDAAIIGKFEISPMNPC